MAMKEGNILNILKSGSRQARLRYDSSMQFIPLSIRHLACDILLAVQNFDNQKEQDFEFYNTLVRFTAKTGQICTLLLRNVLFH